jgi:predicted dehydrogenase
MRIVLIGASNNLKNINYLIFKKLKITVRYLVTTQINERSKILSKKYNSKAISYKDFKDKDDYEIAYISTHENKRYEIAKHLILNNKDIILEKNFLLDQVKEKELIDLSVKKKTKIFQSLVAKYHNQYDQTIKQHQNEMGKICHINLTFFNPLEDLKNYRHFCKKNGGIINDYLNYIIEILKKITAEKIISFNIIKENINEFGNETSVKLFFQFSNLITSSVLISYDYFKQNQCEIIFKNGLIKFYNPVSFSSKTRIDLILKKNLFQRRISKLKKIFFPRYRYYNLGYTIKSKIFKFNDPIYEMFKNIYFKNNLSKLEFKNLDLFHKIKQAEDNL